MIKLAHKGEVESLNHLPLEVIKVASEIATILDDNYSYSNGEEYTNSLIITFRSP